MVRKLLDDGHSVRVLHRKTSKLTALTGLDYESALGDVTDLASMQAAFAGCDWVFHVAAVADYWQADHNWMFQVNVEGTRKVLQAARDAGVGRVVFTSSGAAVGLTQGKQLSDETTAFNLPPEQFPYGYSKHLAEEIVQEAVAEHGQDVVIVNPAIVIGPGDLNLISGTFIVEMARWQWLTPISHGGVPLIDVRDVAAMHVAAAEKGRSGERYILSSANLTDREWFGMMADVMNVAAPKIAMPVWLLPHVARMVRLLRRVGINTPIDADQVLMGGEYIFYDASKAHTELCPPQIEMRRSVEETYQWYVDHGVIKTSPLTRIIGAVGRLWR